MLCCRWHTFGCSMSRWIIPWDDDIDLGMMRKDYDKLLKIIRKIKLPHPYRFLTPETDPGYGKGFIRLTNIDTFALAKNNA